jgi:hypothetical protein
MVDQYENLQHLLAFDHQLVCQNPAYVTTTVGEIDIIQVLHLSVTPAYAGSK